MKHFSASASVRRFLRLAKYWLAQLAVSLLVVLIMLPNFAVAEIAASADKTRLSKERVFGVLALNGTERALQLWGPMVEYLNRQSAPLQFRLQPLAFSEIETAVRNGEVDYLIANPALYVAMEKKHQIFRVATLARQLKGQWVDQFGGVIIGAKGVDFQQVLALNQERIAAVDSYSLGGYLMQKQMIAKQLNIPINDNRISFYHSHAEVVNAVISGDKQLGFIRTGVLEWADKAELLEVFSTVQTPDFPLKVSTQLFAEWPLASLAHIDRSEAAQLLKLLLSWQSPPMELDETQAYSWTVPQNYAAIHELLREFHLEPYQQTAKLSVDEWLIEYREWGYFLGALLFGLLLMSGLFRQSARRHWRSRRQALPLSPPPQRQIGELQPQAGSVAEQAELLALVSDKLHQGILVFSIAGRIAFSNERGQSLLGYTSAELSRLNAHQLFADFADRTVLHEVIDRLDDATEVGEGIDSRVVRLLDARSRPIVLRISLTPLRHQQAWWLMLSLEELAGEMQIGSLAEHYMSASGALLFTSGMDFRLHSVNQRAREIFHLGLHRVLAKGQPRQADALLDVTSAGIFWLDEWLPEPSRERLRELLGELALAATPKQVHFEWLYGLGEQALELSLKCVYVDDAHLPEPFYLCVAHDVSELPETSKPLALTYKNFDSVVLKNQNGILVIDDKGEIKFANQAAQQLMGCERNSPPGGRFALPTGDDLDRHSEIEIICANGRKGVAEVTYSETEWEGSRAYLVLMYDMTQLKQAQQAIEHEATHDNLTNLPNRRYFLDALPFVIKRCENTGEAFALLFMDLDRFKNVNDTLGHAIGDELLVQVAERLKHVLRKADLLARVGGDEFMILLEGVQGTESVARVCRTLVEALEKPFQIGEHHVYSGCSLGVSLYPTNSQNASELLKMADAAMYHAKHQNAQKCTFFQEALLEGSLNRFHLETELNRAIAEQQFTVYYQPQYNPKNQRFCGFEALIRWNHPQQGMIAPDRFIPMLESTGKIHKVGEWVLRQAIADFQKWFGNRPNDLIMGVNVSTLQLMNSDFCELMERVLRETGCDPRHLAIEVTESSFAKKRILMAKVLQKLGALGVEIQMDDFGTGYSSLSRLKDMPFNAVKIDQSFVREIVRDQRDRVMVAAAIETIHAFGMKVIVEGVEQEQQRQILEEIGCDLMQGYLFSRPLPADELYAAFIEKTLV